MFSVPGNPTGHLGSHSIMPVPSTSPFCPNYLRKQSEVKPSGKFCRNGPVTSMILCVRVSISLDIRYLLFVVEQIGHASYLFDEMVFVD